MKPLCRLFAVLLSFALLLGIVPAGAALEPPPDEERPSTEEMAGEIFELCNKARVENGYKALEWSDELAGVAQTRAGELTVRYSHDRPDDSDWYTAIKEAGLSFSRASENIGAGTVGIDKVMEAWLNNEGHRKNILSEHTMTAACVVVFPESGEDYTRYAYIQLFLTPKK